MSMSIPRTSTANGDEVRSASTKPGRPKDDFEAFLIMPAEAQQAAAAPVFADQECSKELSLPSKETTVRTEESAAVTPVRPEPQPAVKKVGTEQTVEIAVEANLPETADLKFSSISGTGETSENTICQMPPKPNGLDPSTRKSGMAVGPPVLDSIGPRETTEAFPSSPQTSESKSIVFQDQAFQSNGNPAFASFETFYPKPLKNIFLTADGQPIRPIEIEVKGTDVQQAHASEISRGLYPAGGFDLTPPRIRVSFAEIADVLRSGEKHFDTTLSASIADPNKTDLDLSDGTAAFADSGSNPLPQTPGSLKIEPADAAGFARSIQQIETEILQLASAASLRAEGRSLKIRLDSADLGAVEITLVKNEGGSMSAHLVTDRESSMQALNENLTQLRGSLENAGLHLHELEISCRSFSGGTQQGGRQGRDGDQAATGPFHSAATQDASGISEANGESDIRLLNLRA